MLYFLSVCLRECLNILASPSQYWQQFHRYNAEACSLSHGLYRWITVISILVYSNSYWECEKHFLGQIALIYKTKFVIGKALWQIQPCSIHWYAISTLTASDMQYSGLGASSPLAARLQDLGICLQHFVNRNRTPREIGPIWKSHSARLSRSYVVINDGEKTASIYVRETRWGIVSVGR